MLRIEDDEYGVLYLAPLTGGWYIEFDTEYPHYVRVIVRGALAKIKEYTKEMPDVVWNKIKNKPLPSSLRELQKIND